jgi:hypothetical protein
MKTARWSDTPTDPGAADPGLPVVETGDYVTLERLDGTRLSGHMCAITADSVTVGIDRWIGGKLGLEKHAIPRGEIRAVSKEYTSQGRTLLILGGFVVAIAVGAVVDFAAHGY